MAPIHLYDDNPQQSSLVCESALKWPKSRAGEHPEWLVVNEQGCPVGTPLYEADFYRRLCLNSPYVETFLKPHVQEVLETLPTDGIFFDIVAPVDCSCRYCRAKMENQDLEPSDPKARRVLGLQTINDFKREMTSFVRQFNGDCSIFYNAGHIGTRHRAIMDAYTHFELGADAAHPIDCLGMTGKFHTSWGDFHSFKNEPALQFECFQMLALGAKCSIGDQLHPSGEGGDRSARIRPHRVGLRRGRGKGTLVPKRHTRDGGRRAHIGGVCPCHARGQAAAGPDGSHANAGREYPAV